MLPASTMNQRQLPADFLVSASYMGSQTTHLWVEGNINRAIYIPGGPCTIAGVAYDCFALPNEEVKAIAKGTPPAHLNRMHNMAHEVFPSVDHTPNKKPDAPAYFLAKTCDRSTMGGCQNATNNSFEWVVSSFTWNGASGTWKAKSPRRTRTVPSLSIRPSTARAAGTRTAS